MRSSNGWKLPATGRKDKGKHRNGRRADWLKTVEQKRVHRFISTRFDVMNAIYVNVASKLNEINYHR